MDGSARYGCKLLAIGGQRQGLKPSLSTSLCKAAGPMASSPGVSSTACSRGIHSVRRRQRVTYWGGQCSRAHQWSGPKVDGMEQTRTRQALAPASPISSRCPLRQVLIETVDFGALLSERCTALCGCWPVSPISGSTVGDSDSTSRTFAITSAAALASSGSAHDWKIRAPRIRASISCS
jgi:hypothetical protein